MRLRYQKTIYIWRLSKSDTNGMRRYFRCNLLNEIREVGESYLIRRHVPCEEDYLLKLCRRFAWLPGLTHLPKAEQSCSDVLSPSSGPSMSKFLCSVFTTPSVTHCLLAESRSSYQSQSHSYVDWSLEGGGSEYPWIGSAADRRTPLRRRRD